MEKAFTCWVEIQANKACITDPAAFRAAMEKCKAAGLTGVILSVKDPSGFAIYNSAIAPHYSLYDSTFAPGVDYVRSCFAILREVGLQCYASFDVFAEGDLDRPHPQMKGLQEDWCCHVYGLDEEGKAKILPSTQGHSLHTVGSIDDFGEIFVNPGNPQVRNYALSLIREFAAQYHPDGIVLDRVRYVGLSTDFSELSRQQWEDFTGIHDARWPEDIYTISDEGGEAKAVPGKYYGSFFCYRASILKAFLQDVSAALKEYQIPLWDYTGSWYPLYDLVGANWASEAYVPVEFPHCDPQALAKTAYAEIPDQLLSGFYYPDVWESSVVDTKPAYWYSVEGACRIAKQVTCGKKALIGSLYLQQYVDCPERLPQAIAVCKEKSGGCMLFDLSHIMTNDWWNLIAGDCFVPYRSDMADQAASLCDGAFLPSFGVTGETIGRRLLTAPDFSPECSFFLRHPMTGACIGFVGVKISQNQTLYPNAAWVALMCVAPEYQGQGWGKMMLLHLDTLMKAHGIKRLYIGQDMQCLFSGIPDPTAAKQRFFQGCGFTLNCDLHYDLEASVQRNPQMDDFDETAFAKDFEISTLSPDHSENLVDFVNREFPGRWVEELKTALLEGKDPRQIVVLKKRTDGQICGYCLIHPAEKTSGLGPIGISRSLRGKHLGDYLLHGALRQLRNLGADRVNIDWTILVKFYGQFGFVPERTYLAAYKDYEKE